MIQNCQPIINMAQFPTVACCICGIPIEANESRMCAVCLHNEVDITSEISRNCLILRCRDCLRWSKPPYVHCEMESKELLGLCLKKIRGLQSVKLVDASFIWTETHSKRMKVKIVIQKEVLTNVILEKSMIVDFMINSSQCDVCKKVYTPHTWNALVQIRQKAAHRKSMFYLEQLIIKHDAHDNVSNIVNKQNGLDFQFAQRNSAAKFSDFVCSVLPVRKQASKQLISHNTKTNTHNHKYTIGLEIAPVCKDDLVLLPSKIASTKGGGSSLLVCIKVSTYLRFLDVANFKVIDIPPNVYWKYPFDSLLSRHHLTDFVILDVEKSDSQNNNIDNPDTSTKFRKYELGHAEVARVGDLGRNDDRCVIRTHQAAFLKCGDVWKGYDLRELNLAGHENYADRLGGFEVILIKRNMKPAYGDRPWTLKRLPMEMDGQEEDDPMSGPRNNRHVRDTGQSDWNAFVDDVEMDPDLMGEFNVYKNKKSRRRKETNKMEIDTDESKAESIEAHDTDYDELFNVSSLIDALPRYHAIIRDDQ